MVGKTGNINDDQQNSFVEDSLGNVARNVVAEIVGSLEGSFAPSGLRIGGKVTIVTVTTTWTALPTAALDDRNAMSIQNTSDVDIKINYDDEVVGFEGILIKSGFERYYDIKDTIIIYAKVATGTAVVAIEELA